MAKNNSNPNFLLFSTATLPPTAAQNFIPARLEWSQANPDTLVLRISGKDKISKKTTNSTQLVFGIDIDGKNKTSEKSSKLGVEFLLIVNNSAGDWSSYLKDPATENTLPLPKPLLDQDRIVIELPLALLNYPKLIRIQLAFSQDNNKYEFDEVALINLKPKLQCCL